jgi:hypothetical protein
MDLPNRAITLRIEKEITIFVRMGFDVDELVLLLDDSVSPTEKHIIPRIMAEELPGRQEEDNPRRF